MARASVFVTASYCEGFPNVLLEAMACGTPVITTDWAGAGEIVIDGATGLIVPAGDAVQLAAAIANLLTDRGRARRLANAAARRLDQFARPRIIRRYERLLRAHAQHARAAGRVVEAC
jgi:glycosyltransferase involved in cell wall biosynthesis